MGTDTSTAGTPSVEVKFTEERETKHSVRFQEVGGEKIGTIYVKKPTLAEIGNPRNIVVTIEAGEA